MWPDSPFASSRGSFENPVLPPNVDPDASPTLSVAINCSWLPFVRGALKQLLLQSTWQDGSVPLDTTQERVFNLIGLFQECSGSSLPFACSGDFTSNPDPFSVWSISGCGTWVPGSGYVGQRCGPFGGHDFNDIAIDMTPSTTYTLTDVVVTYDMIPGTWVTSTGDDAVFIVDVIHSNIIAALPFSALVPGTGQTLAFSGSIAGVQNLHFEAASDKVNTGDPLTGIVTIRNVEVRGIGDSLC